MLAEQANNAQYVVRGTMRVMRVPQVGHVPCKAGRPLESVTCCGLAISFVARHFTQYALFDIFTVIELSPFNR